MCTGTQTLVYDQTTVNVHLTEPEPQHPHPGAPAEFKDAFSDFLKKFETSSTRKFVAVEPKKDAVRRTTVNSNVYENFWEAPSRLWRPKAKEITKEEMNAVVVSLSSHEYC